jgi:hypothetical protein
MKKSSRTFLLFAACGILASTLAAWGLPALAQQDLQERVNSIESVEQVKQELRQLFEWRDQCGTGSCFNSSSTGICETVAALDARVNGQIVGGMISDDSGLPISEEDLDLMRLIFEQCKPTNYQYWNWPMMLHVWYVPSEEVDNEIKNRLGLFLSP